MNRKKTLLLTGGTQGIGRATVEYFLRRDWRVNNLSPFLLIQSCLDALKKRRGSIVYVGSMSDNTLAAGYAAYGASKAHMRAFVSHAAADLGPLGIRINVVSPGSVDTPAIQVAIDAMGAGGREQARQLLQRIPMEQRWGDPAEIAEAIWFAVTGPRYFHGRDLRVDGGGY